MNAQSNDNINLKIFEKCSDACPKNRLNSTTLEAALNMVAQTYEFNWTMISLYGQENDPSCTQLLDC